MAVTYGAKSVVVEFSGDQIVYRYTIVRSDGATETEVASMASVTDRVWSADRMVDEIRRDAMEAIRADKDRASKVQTVLAALAAWVV